MSTVPNWLKLPSQNNYTVHSVPPAVPVHAPCSLPRAVFPSRMAIRGQMGRVPLAGVRPRRRCRLISRNGNQFKSFPALAESLPAEIGARSAIFDGEIVALDRHGKTQFRYLLFGIGLLRYIQDATVTVSMHSEGNPCLQRLFPRTHFRARGSAGWPKRLVRAARQQP